MTVRVRVDQVSNLLGSPASGEAALITVYVGVEAAFPIYWVPQRVGSRLRPLREGFGRVVSNLLGSPASGEPEGFPPGLLSKAVSNLLGSPASGEF